MKTLKNIFAGAALLFSIGSTGIVYAQDMHTEPLKHDNTRQEEVKPNHDEKMMKENCLMLKEGKVVQMKDGKSAEIDKEVTLKNGDMVMMDGTVMKKDGKKIKLKEGECMDMNGMMMMNTNEAKHDKVKK